MGEEGKPQKKFAQDEANATAIQRRWRGIMARKKYQIKSLDPVHQQLYKTFVVGNDPVIHGLKKHHEPQDKIALIAVSGMRSVAIACELGNPQKIPKIFIIDISINVCKFWNAFKEFVSDEKKAGSVGLFWLNLPNFLLEHNALYKDLSEFGDLSEEDIHENLCTPHVEYPDQHIEFFFRQLIERQGYEYVRAVIMHATVFNQNWKDPEIFIKLKNILQVLNINKVYIYASDVVTCYEEENEQNLILDNLSKLPAQVTIHVRSCSEHNIPEKVFLFETANPAEVLSTLLKENDAPRSHDEEDIAKFLAELKSAPAEEQENQTLKRRRLNNR